MGIDVGLRRDDRRTGAVTRGAAGWTASPDDMDDRPAADARSTREPGPAVCAGPGRARERRRPPARHPAELDATPAQTMPRQHPARAAVDLGRALTDARSGDLRGRIVRAVLGGLPIGLGLGWMVGELTGRGRALPRPATRRWRRSWRWARRSSWRPCCSSPRSRRSPWARRRAARGGGAASLILSATGAAADEGSRRAALGRAARRRLDRPASRSRWSGGSASGPRPAGPVS